MFRRKFRRTFGNFKRGSFRRFGRRSSGRRTAIKQKSRGTNSTVTQLTFPASRITRQPLPDRYFTWMFIESHGNLTGSPIPANFTFAFSINDPSLPFNSTGAVASALPNPFTANTTLQPAGLKNILLNSTTNTGIYANFRVWSTIVSVTLAAQNAVDSGYVAMAPLVGSSASYGTSFENLCAAPNSASRAFDDTTINDSTFSRTWSIPALLGIPKTVYSALTSTIGSFSAAPSTPMYCQVGIRSSNGTNFTTPVGIRVRIAFHVEFLSRTDSGLLFS